MGVQRCWGSGGGASMGPRQQLIIAGGASVAPSNMLAAVLAEAHQRNFVGGIVGAVGGGSPFMGWRWNKATIKKGW